MRSKVRLRVVAPVVLAGAAASASAGPFGVGNLVVMRVSTTNPGGGGSVILDEYTRLGASVGNSVALPTSGPNAFSMSDALNHDRHLHLSTDQRYLTLAGYGVAPGATDPAAGGSDRVVGIVDSSGSVDLTTRLTDAYRPTSNANSIRGAFTTDGTNIWVAGDNAGDTSTTGGLRYTTRGSSTSVNLSRTQVNGGSPQADNVRDLRIVGGQLYDCSGSGSSIGKAVLQVGTGMPTSGAQTVTSLTTDAISQSSFVMLDLNPAIPGVDTMYTAADNLRKYILQPNGTWASAGFVAFGTLTTGIFDQVIAASNGDGTVSVFAGGALGVVSLLDPAGMSGSLTGLSSNVIISAPSGYTLGGIEFSPVPAPGSAAIVAVGALAAARRRRAR